MNTPETLDGPWASTRTPSERPASQRSGRSAQSKRSLPSSRTTEETPLLAREDRGDDDEQETGQTSATTSLLRSLGGSGDDKTPFWKKRWPSILALVLLCVVVVFIMLGFLATEGIEEYAMQAADFKPTKLALDSLTPTGVKVQVEGDFKMDASKVKKQSVRNLGRFGTWIAREVESGPSSVDVYLPEYGNILLGSAKVPSIKVNIRNGHTTHVSFFTDVEPGSFDGIRNIADEWLRGNIGKIRVKGKAEVPLKSGLIHLGTQTVEQYLELQGDALPTLPAYNITKINLRDAENGYKGMGADVSVDVTNEFPVQINIPPVGVDVLVDGCRPSDKHIMVGTAETARIHVEPKTDLHVNVTGHVEDLPDSLTDACPNSEKSPLDSLIGQYMQGAEATVYVNCCTFPDPETPSWAGELLKDITVPLKFAGRDMGNLIKNFSMADVHFHLPKPWAEPGSPEASPTIDAVVKVFITLPDEMNFNLSVNGIMADADVFYKKKKLGELNLDDWQKANSTRYEGHKKEKSLLVVEADIEKAPLKITDDDVFSEVVQALMFGSKDVKLGIKAAVGVEVGTPMGKFAIREIPAEGAVNVKPIRSGNGDGDGDDHKGGSGFPSINLKMGNLSIVDTTPTSLIMQAHVNFTNPTNYSATVPYFNIHILVNGTVMGEGIAKDIRVHPGNNTNIVVTAVWDPSTQSGEEGQAVGREWLSQYISGFNTSMTVQTHNGSIPAQPSFGFALSQLPITFATPRLSGPKEPPSDDPSDPDKPAESPHFIKDATMHIISSTAIFTLASPFATTTMYITHMNATSYYEGHPAGKILYDLPFAVPPGDSVTPRLPVDWSLGGVGFEAVKKALGGTLKLSAFAEVGVRIGRWKEQVWYQGRSIGANIRL